MARMPKRAQEQPRTNLQVPPGIQWLLAILCAVGIAAFVHFRSPNFADPDALYHLTHASIYLERGPFYQEFPWAAKSMIGLIGSDLWWGFHVLLLPFALIGDQVLAVKLAGVALITGFILLQFGLYRRLQIPLPFLWPMLALFASPLELWRWMAIRPSLISMPLLAILLVLLLRGTSLWAVALCAFTIGFIHQTLSWVVPIVAVIALVIGLMTHRKFLWAPIVAIIGCGLAWVLRPGAIGAMQLMKIQIFDLATLKNQGIVRDFGIEMLPLSMDQFQVFFVYFTALWIVAALLFLIAVYVARVPMEAVDRATVWCAFLISLVFFQITLLSSQRAADVWIVFAVLSIAIVFGRLISALRERINEKSAYASAIVAGTGFAVIAPVIGLAWFSLHVSGVQLKQFAPPFDRFRGAMEWAKVNTPEGSLIFHSGWSAFPEMFFWNRHNRFIGGMDPVFQYRFDPDLYWAALRIEYEISTSTTSKLPIGQEGQEEDSFTVLTRDFGADYVLAIQPITPQFYSYLKSDPRYRLMYDAEGIAIFKPDLSR